MLDLDWPRAQLAVGRMYLVWTQTQGETMTKHFWHVLLFLSLSCLLLAQELKPSPASDALIEAAKDMATNQKSLDTVLQQARAGMDASQKSLRDKLVALNKELEDKLRADKKYAPMLQEIKTANDQLNSVAKDANDRYNRQAAPLQYKIATDNALIQGLVPVVRKENNLPDTTTFDPATQKWSTKKEEENADTAKPSK